jgi:double zinc ribbon protein
MLPFAYFGIESSGLSLVVDLLILFVVVLYFSLIYWTFADARRRILDPMLIGCATAASLFPFVGTIVYVILRPPEYLDDVRERELEMQAAEARLYELDHSLCPHCDYRVERDFIRCPSCLRKLKERCESCSRPLDQAWAICPYCETEVPGASSRRPRRRRPPAPESERTGHGQTAAARAGRLIDDDRTEVAAAVDSSAPPLRRSDRDPRAAPVAPAAPVAAPAAPVAEPEPVIRPRRTH